MFFSGWMMGANFVIRTFGDWANGNAGECGARKCAGQARARSAGGDGRRISYENSRAARAHQGVAAGPERAARHGQYLYGREPVARAHTSPAARRKPE